ncbi:MAG: M23 family metallopeptidase [Caulobacteraceae bacterium]
MNNNNFENIPKPRYVKEYRRFDDMFRIRKHGERSYIDKLLLQSLISIATVAVVLIISSINTGITNTISDSIKSTINWNVNISKALDTFSNFRSIIPETKKNLGVSEALPEETNAEAAFIMPIEGEVTSEFGERVHPVFKTVKMHTGIDIDGAIGTPIKSSTPGKVKQVGEDAINGKYIRIENGIYEVVYAHCYKVNVKEGQSVKQGDIIGEVGDTGLASGPHLHFEIHENGGAVNPLEKLESVPLQ